MKEKKKEYTIAAVLSWSWTVLTLSRPVLSLLWKIFWSCCRGEQEGTSGDSQNKNIDSATEMAWMSTSG